MNKVISTVLASLLLASSSAFAGAGGQPGAGQTSAAASAESPDLVDGEVRKVDTENNKITIRHGEIKNLEMPAMSMVFQVKDPSMLGSVKVGDKVRFAAEKANGGIVITELRPAQ